MAYLQPWMLWALPAVLLPIVIHLLNRLRYKTVYWAAMIFLLKANRAATRRAKIRQYLLLACRCLIILFLIWAMARPLVGGWIGSAAGGAPEAVLILLDRSASMEGRGNGQPETKRAHALALLAQAAKASIGSRFVLIENVLRQPLEIADASTLAAMQAAEPTDTAADLPAMFRVALDYLTKNKPGSAEVWVASDLQASNWRAESPEWQDLSARLAGLPQEVRIRVIDLSAPAAHNLSVAVKGAEVRVRDSKAGTGRLSVNLELRNSVEGKTTLPLLVTREGVTNQLDITTNAAVQRQNLRFDLAKLEPGWGKVELPADDLPSDNSAYFVYAPPMPLRATVVGDGPAALRLRFAAAPDKTRTDRTADVIPGARAEVSGLKEAALAIWAAPAPSDEAGKALTAWVEAGGVLLCFPPGGEGGSGPAGVSWGTVESAKKEAPFRVAAWDDLDGPLAKTDSGAPLPVARLELQKRQVPIGSDTAHVYATFADGRAFLIGQKLGSGYVYACASVPDPEWGNLGEGLVLVPMVQRLFLQGGQRLSPPAMAISGEWKPASADETWTSVETDRRHDWRWHAGVYQSGAQRVALNRPESEDLPDTLDRGRLPEILHGAKLTVMAGAMELKADRLQSEIWPAMIIVAMLFMCGEMLLATSKAMLPAKAAPRPPAPRPSTPAGKPMEVAV